MEKMGFERGLERWVMRNRGGRASTGGQLHEAGELDKWEQEGESA